MVAQPLKGRDVVVRKTLAVCAGLREKVFTTEDTEGTEVFLLGRSRGKAFERRGRGQRSLRAQRKAFEHNSLAVEIPARFSREFFAFRTLDR
jgi:hypothetical protein